MAGCAVGTAKSRVFRARRRLEVWLTGEESVSDAGERKKGERVQAGVEKKNGGAQRVSSRMSVAVV